MYVTIDQIWASPSTLHVRCLVHDDQGKWRHKFYPSMDLEEVPEEALAALVTHFVTRREEEAQQPLF